MIGSYQGVQWLDQQALWARLAQDKKPQRERLGQMLAMCGVEFFDSDHRYAKAPVVLIRSLGGLPIVWKEQPFVGGVEVREALQQTRQQMGYAAMDTYLNPNDKTAQDLYTLNLATHGAPSIAHTVHLGFFIAGLSQKAELEFNTQRDLVHLSRLTSARTSVQDNPPFLVEDANMLPLYQALRQSILDHRPEGVSKEYANAVWPLSKCSILGITGSLKNLWKLSLMKDDAGKEQEVRNLCAVMQQQILALYPEWEQI